jgi:hypothetical protein
MNRHRAAGQERRGAELASVARMTRVCTFIAAVVLLLASSARAESTLLDSSQGHERSMLLSVHGVLPYGYLGQGTLPLGVGASFYIPLVKEGFIRPVNDEFGLDFGADAIFFPGYANGIAFFVPVSVLWTFHFTQSFAAYVKVGAALRIWPGYAQSIYPDLVTGIGLNWMFSKSIGLRAEVGYPGVKIGVLVAF